MSFQEENSFHSDMLSFDSLLFDDSFHNNPKLNKIDVVPNQVDIYKFIYPNKQNEIIEDKFSSHSAESVSDKKSGILETAFSSLIVTAANGNRDARQFQLRLPKETDSPAEGVESPDLFHSPEDIRKIQEQSTEARTDAFHQLTHFQEDPEKYFASNDLQLEFSSIHNNDKMNVFIEEFEHLILKLNSQKPVIEKKPDNMEYLIQFKLSIHLIKLLSEMMQANYLYRFSQVVIEFLDELVDGKTCLTSDVIKRLSTVIICYEQYNYSIKEAI